MKRLLILLTILLPLQSALVAIDDPVLSPEQLQLMRDQVAQLKKEIPGIKKRARQSIGKLFKNIEYHRYDNIKEHNRLLGKVEVPLPKSYKKKLGLPNKISFGVYKYDIWVLETLANLAANYYIYHTFWHRRTDHVTDVLCKDYKEIIELLNRLEDAQSAAQFDAGLKQDVWAVLGAALKVRKEFSKTFAPKSAYIGYNFFKKELLLPLGLAVGVSQAAWVLKRKYSKIDLTKNQAFQRYTYENGKYKPLKDYPMSLSFVTKYCKAMVTNPILIPMLIFAPLGGFAGYCSDTLDFSVYQKDRWVEDKIKNFAINQSPSWSQSLLRSQAMSMAFHFLILGTCVMAVDSLYNSMWVDYVLEHRKELLLLLNQYKELQEASEKNQYDQEVVKKIEYQKELIKQFVSAGNSIKSKFPGKDFEQWRVVRSINSGFYSWENLALLYVSIWILKITVMATRFGAR